MIFKNLQYTIRNFKNQKLFTFVNVAGLTIGIIAASLILIYISYELSFDRFHKNSDQIFRVYGTFNFGGKNEAWVQTPNPLGPFLQNKFPEIEKTVRITRLSKGLVSSGDISFFEDRIVLADSTVFDIFTFPLLIGNPKSVLSQPNSVVLTESAAEKYFGESDPVGKTIRYNRTIDFTVTGIMKDIPGNTHLQFDMMVSMPTATTLFRKDFLEDRMSTVTNLYLMANQTVNADSLEKYVSQSTKEYDDGADFGDNKKYHVQELTSIHLHSNMGGEFAANSDIKSIYILSTIAFLILSIACINYINLSFSMNNRRTKELGIRKIMGARRAQLIFLYISDASVLVGISIITAALTISDYLPWFSRLVGSDLSKNYSVKSLLPAYILLFLLITFITGLASGWISSRISPMDTFKKPFTKTKNRIGIQGLLVLFQFGISIVLIASSLVVYRQMKFIQNLNLGFSKEQLMIIPINDNTMRSRIISFKNELIRNPNILSAGVTSDLPGEMKWVASIDYEGNVKGAVPMGYLAIDKDFFSTFGVHLKEGYLPGDTACPYTGTHYLLNESAVTKLGWEDPIGKKFSSYNGKDGFVTGIIRDFNFKSLREKVEPLFLFERESDPKFIAVKLNTNQISSSVDFTKNLWNKMVPDSPFEYFFYDDYYNQLYKKESLFGKVIFIFSAIAILIACMGLFGLAAFFSELRTKEIGVRKVNGATIPEIMAMLNMTFLKWVFIAFLIAIPFAWFAMNRWLQTFAYKTDLSWWIFAISGIIVLSITLITVSWQSWRAATKNPVDALRYE
ncbi:MAG: ABC transporter permease [Bacteroidales bacterium]|nr:ABC transporter permease [Bacteroidales bacterium]